MTRHGMLPREHGAYGQLVFPIVTALAVGRPGAAAFAVTGAAMCVFLAHEPLLVLLGERGRRAARDDRQRAMRWIQVLAVATAAAGVPLLVLSTRTVQLALVVPFVFAAALLTTIVVGREHTIGGEIHGEVHAADIPQPAGWRPHLAAASERDRKPSSGPSR